MAVQIIDYFESNANDYWIAAIEESDWVAGKYLAKLLREDNLKALCGPSTKVLLLTEDKKLYSFCTLAEQDEVKAPDMSPWIGFVYTFPEYRGNHYAGMLIDKACEIAKQNGATEIFTSPPIQTNELYEKKGFTCLDYTMPTIYGYDTTVFRKDL